MTIPFLESFPQLVVWFVVVNPWEQAIRVTCGKKLETLQPGMYWRVPFVHKVFKQSVRRRLSMVRPQALTTSDGHTISVAGTLGYAIADLTKLFNTLENPNDTLESEAASVVARYVGSHSKSECTAPLLEKFVCGTLDLTKYGLKGQEFYVTSFVCCKTYRLITGEIAAWQRDDHMKMEEHKPT